MSKNLTELESRLYEQVKNHRKVGDDLVNAVNSRNQSRVAEQESDERMSRMRNKLIIVGIFAVGALVAYFYYKATFGMF